MHTPEYDPQQLNKDLLRALGDQMTRSRQRPTLASLRRLALRALSRLPSARGASSELTSAVALNAAEYVFNNYKPRRPPPKESRPEKQEVKAQIRELYRSGMSIAELSKISGKSTSAIARMLPRREGESRRNIADREVAAIVDLLERKIEGAAKAIISLDDLADRVREHIIGPIRIDYVLDKLNAARHGLFVTPIGNKFGVVSKERWLSPEQAQAFYDRWSADKYKNSAFFFPLVNDFAFGSEIHELVYLLDELSLTSTPAWTDVERLWRITWPFSDASRLRYVLSKACLAPRWFEALPNCIRNETRENQEDFEEPVRITRDVMYCGDTLVAVAKWLEWTPWAEKLDKAMVEGLQQIRAEKVTDANIIVVILRFVRALSGKPDFKPNELWAVQDDQSACEEADIMDAELETGRFDRAAETDREDDEADFEIGLEVDSVEEDWDPDIGPRGFRDEAHEHETLLSRAGMNLPARMS